MTRHMTSITLLLAGLSLLCSCNKERMQTVSLSPDAQSIEALVGYCGKALVFRDDVCVSVCEIEDVSVCPNLSVKPGDKVKLLAYKNPDSFIFSPSAAGSPSGSYNLQTVDSRTFNDGLWVADLDIEGSVKKVIPHFRPVSSVVSLNIINAPSGFDNARLNIDNCTNTYYAFSDSLVSEIVASPCVMMARPDSKTASVLPPPRADEPWTPALNLTLDKKTFFPSLELSQGISPGVDVSITVDLSAYPEDGSYSVGAVLTEHQSGKVIESVRKRFQTVYSKDCLYSKDYAVYYYKDGVWQETDAFETLCSDAGKHRSIWNDWDNTKELRDTTSYCIIEHDFNTPLRIRVRKLRGSFSSCEVRPTTYGITPTVSGSGAVEFELPYDQRKVSIEFDGDRFHNLFIYANKPYESKPSADDPGVHYFGPGFHNPGTINLSEGETLFIDYGAVVYGNVVASGSDVTIMGNGILSGQKMKHWGDDQYSWGDFLVNIGKESSRAVNLTLKDVTLIDGPGWNVIVRNIDHVRIDGVNTISWELNGDGLDICSCKDVEISNCFLRNYDDNITLKIRFIVNPMTDVSDVDIHHCLIWNDYARGIVVGPEAGTTTSGYLHDIRIHDCIFLEHGNGGAGDLRAALAIGQGSKGNTDLWSGTDPPAKISGVSVSDLIFDNISSAGRAVAIWQYKSSGAPVQMSDITFENFTILDGNSSIYPALYIKTNGASIKGLKIKGLKVDGTPVTAVGGEFSIDTPSNVEYTIE